MSDIREELRAYLARTGSSLSAVAKAVDRSPSAISLWAKNDYTGDAEAIERAVASFLARQQEKAAGPVLEGGPLAKTSQAKATAAVLRYCHVYQALGVVVGPAGCGKTRTVQDYAAQNAGVIVLTIDPSNRSLAEVIHQLSELVGDTGKGRGTLGGIAKRLKTKLAGSGRLLIVDEGQYLEHPVIELLRSVYDSARVGVVFCGMPRMYRDLVANTVELWEQVRTRVGMRKRLPPFAAEDALILLRSVDPQVSPDVCRTAWELGEHCGRSTAYLYHHAARLAALGHRAVTPADVLAAQEFLYEPPIAAPARPAAPPPKPAARPAERPQPMRPAAAAKAAG